MIYKSVKLFNVNRNYFLSKSVKHGKMSPNDFFVEFYCIVAAVLTIN